MTTTFYKNSTERLAKYVSGLKHGSSFKYVKGLKAAERTLLNILYTRQIAGNNGTKLTNEEMRAFGMQPTDKNGMIFQGDVTVDGRPCIIPVATF